MTYVCLCSRPGGPTFKPVWVENYLTLLHTPTRIDFCIEKKEGCGGSEIAGAAHPCNAGCSIAFNFMLTTEEQKAYDFSMRCCMVAAHLWQGKSVTLTAAQLAYYNRTPHQVILELSECLRSEEMEACWEEEVLYRGSRRQRTYIVYCTKVQDKYVFKAKLK